MATKTIQLDQDLHVHSTFSDGVNSIEENVNQAESIGLKVLGCVDHVRNDTTWVPDFAQYVRAVATDIDLVVGVEAKILDASGTLDMPLNTVELVDAIYAADHRFPLEGRCVSPRSIREMFKEGSLGPKQAVQIYFESMHRVLERYKKITFAHIFSIFPKIHLNEDSIDEELLHNFASHCASENAVIEIDERWRCPGLRSVEIFLQHGVSVVASSDSHRKESIGRYQYVSKLVEELS